MTGKKLALFFLLIMALELMLVDASPWFWRRRRRRRAAPPPPPTTPKPTTVPTTPKPTPAPCNDSMPPLPVNVTWTNEWHQSFNASCPHAYSMIRWISLYRGCQQDRIHLLRCRLGPAFYDSSHCSDCSWTPLLHDVKRSFFYKCPNNGFITGVISYFNKVSKDRRVGLKCCRVKGYRQFNCKTTSYQNSFGGLLNYIVPNGYTMTGLGSYHSVASTASYSDRLWRFEICQVKLSPW